MGDDAGVRICPEIFKTTIMLMTARDSSARIFLLFIDFSVWLFVSGRRQRFLAFSISDQFMGRIGHLPWGVTLL
jgi:hypothetical protein